MHQPKCCEYNNEDEDNCQDILSGKKNQLILFVLQCSITGIEPL